LTIKCYSNTCANDGLILGLINSSRGLLTDSVIYFFISIRTPHVTTEMCHPKLYALKLNKTSVMLCRALSLLGAFWMVAVVCLACNDLSKTEPSSVLIQICPHISFAILQIHRASQTHALHCRIHRTRCSCATL
jgi:hypothetical protein